LGTSFLRHERRSDYEEIGEVRERQGKGISEDAR